MDFLREQISVFLARTPTELAGAQARIRRDLEERGIAVTMSLDSSQLAVHLLTGDEIQDASASSDLRASLKHTREHPNFPLLVWAPPHQDRDDLLLEVMPRGYELSPGTEIVRGTIEDFKSLIYDRFRSLQAQAPAPKGLEATSGSQLYLIFDTQDTESAAPVREFFAKRGVTVLTADLQNAAQASMLRQMHNEYLRSCDAALIIYGNVREPWVRMKQQDLLRAAALGRKKALAAKAVYLCSQLTPPKQTFSAPGMIVLREDATRRELERTFEPLIHSMEAAA